MDRLHSRRSWLANAAGAAAALALPVPLAACRRPAAAVRDRPTDPDRERLAAWTSALRAEGLATAAVPAGQAAIRTGAQP